MDFVILENTFKIQHKAHILCNVTVPPGACLIYSMKHNITSEISVDIQTSAGRDSPNVLHNMLSQWTETLDWSN